MVNDVLFKKKELQRLNADQDEDARRINQMEKNTEQLMLICAIMKTPTSKY